MRKELKTKTDITQKKWRWSRVCVISAERGRDCTVKKIHAVKSLNVMTPLHVIGFRQTQQLRHKFCAVAVLLLVTGAMVNGPYSLITTAVSADLGTHPCLHGNAKALATVSAIIDGTGSIGDQTVIFVRLVLIKMIAKFVLATQS